jgi:hypothetical protein
VVCTLLPFSQQLSVSKVQWALQGSHGVHCGQISWRKAYCSDCMYNFCLARPLMYELLGHLLMKANRFFACELSSPSIVHGGIIEHIIENGSLMLQRCWVDFHETFSRTLQWKKTTHPITRIPRCREYRRNRIWKVKMSASWNDSRKSLLGRVRPIVSKTSYEDDMLRSFYYALNILWKQPCSTAPEFLHIFFACPACVTIASSVITNIVEIINKSKHLSFRHNGDN